MNTTRIRECINILLNNTPERTVNMGMIKIREMEKLEEYLKENEIPYEEDFYNGYKQICVPVINPEERDWDAVCFPGTYGFEEGLLEIMGNILTPEDEEHDSVVGHLTAEDVIKRIELKKRKNGQRISWDEFNPNELYLMGETWEPIAVSCPKCGEQLQRREDIILTTYPPMRQYRCPVCGWKGMK